MSLRIALQAIGLLVVGYVLFVAFLAMGPVAWVVFGAMLAIGILQVHRKRRQHDQETGDGPQFCANCGAKLDHETGENSSGSQAFAVNYCGSCGAPVPSTADTAPAAQRANCPECGALNDAERTECDYCEATL